MLGLAEREREGGPLRANEPVDRPNVPFRNVLTERLMDNVTHFGCSEVQSRVTGRNLSRRWEVEWEESLK